MKDSGEKYLKEEGKGSISSYPLPSEFLWCGRWEKMSAIPEGTQEDGSLLKGPCPFMLSALRSSTDVALDVASFSRILMLEETLKIVTWFLFSSWDSPSVCLCGFHSQHWKRCWTPQLLFG